MGTGLPLGELAGYIACALVFATFYVRTIVPLRMIAIGSNIAFIGYASLEGLTPVLVLHAALLPVNVHRLYEIKKQIQAIRETPETDKPIDAIIPFMKHEAITKGEYLFRKGDFSKHMYYVLEGELRIVEIDETVSTGSIIGEVGMFSPSRERTASVIADTDCRLLSIDDAALYQAYYQNPKLGFHLISLIASRFAVSRSVVPEDNKVVSIHAVRQQHESDGGASRNRSTH